MTPKPCAVNLCVTATPMPTADDGGGTHHSASWTDRIARFTLPADEAWRPVRQAAHHGSVHIRWRQRGAEQAGIHETTCGRAGNDLIGCEGCRAPRHTLRAIHTTEREVAAAAGIGQALSTPTADDPLEGWVRNVRRAYDRIRGSGAPTAHARASRTLQCAADASPVRPADTPPFMLRNGQGCDELRSLTDGRTQREGRRR